MLFVCVLKGFAYLCTTVNLPRANSWVAVIWWSLMCTVPVPAGERKESKP